MSEFTWTPSQEQCIFSHDGTLLVSAAAGSGKTTVLVQRIVERITHPEHPVDVDRLLVVTFTRAAAAEMKSRLAEALAKLLLERPDDANLQRQQLLLPRASIGTIDSFCGDLVRQNFHQLNIPPQFRVAEEAQLSLIKKEALLETIAEFYEAGDEDFTELASMLGTGRDDSKLMSLIERVDAFLQSHPDPDGWLEKMSAVYDDVTSVRDTVWGKYVAEHVREVLDKAAKLCNTAIALAESEPVLNDQYLPALLSDRSFIQHAREVCDMGSWDELDRVLCTYVPDKLGSKTGKCSDKALKERVQGLRNTVKSALLAQKELTCGDEAQCLSDIHGTRRMVRALYAMTQRFSKLFMEKKIAQRLFGFADISHLALGLLTAGYREDGTPIPTPLAQELSERYVEILIDEYQDTNALQDALFSALSRGEGNLFFVGDVKQSIYGFRQAMPERFLDRRARYPIFEGHTYPGTILLGNNYRSRKQVTEAVNFVFEQLMIPEVGGVRYDENERLEAKAPYEDGEGYETEVLLSELRTADGVKLSNHVADAERVALRIQELVGTLQIKDKKLGMRPLRYGDCCILLRNRNPAYREALERHGIPVVTDESSEFFNTAEIRLALSLLRCIDNPLQDVPLTAWLLSPLCGFSPDDLAQIRRCRPRAALYMALSAARSAVRDTALAARCREAVGFIDRYRTLSCQLTVDQLLRRLYEETALPELMSARADGERRRINLQLLQDTCAQFDQSGFRGLTAFIRYVDKLQKQGISLPGAAKVDTGNSVRVYTIHGSKGLEFPVVFLAGLHQGFSRQDAREDLLLHPTFGAGIKRREPVTLHKYPTLPYRTLLLAGSDVQHEEEMRLLYVAMTRAKEKLCLTMAMDNPLKRLAELSAMLDDEPTLAPFTVRDAGSMGDWLLTALLRHPSAAEWRSLIENEDLPLLPNAWPWTLKLCTPQPLLEAVAEEKGEAATADPAQVQAIRERIAYRYPHGALARIPVKMAASSTAHGAVNRRYVATAQPAFLQKSGLTPTERGTAMHAFMQYADYAAAAQDVAAEAERLTQGGYLTAEQAASLEHGKLRAFFESELYARMARSPRCLREYQFTSLQPASQLDASFESEEPLVIQGMADCLFEEDGALVIVDYKTDRVSEADELIRRYKTQLDVYRDALGRALDLPVRECLLYSFQLDCTVTVPQEA